MSTERHTTARSFAHIINAAEKDFGKVRNPFLVSRAFLRTCAVFFLMGVLTTLQSMRGAEQKCAIHPSYTAVRKKTCAPTPVRNNVSLFLTSSIPHARMRSLASKPAYERSCALAQSGRLGSAVCRRKKFFWTPCSTSLI